jgi:hypothetical protein
MEKNKVHYFIGSLLITLDLFKMLIETNGVEKPCISKQLLADVMITNWKNN